MNLFRLIKQQWLQQGTTTLLLGLSILLTHPALGQSQDASVTKKDPKNYKILVGFGAGGIPDASSRMIAPKLAEKMKSTVIVESKLGVNLHPKLTHHLYLTLIHPSDHVIFH